MKIIAIPKDQKPLATLYFFKRENFKKLNFTHWRQINYATKLSLKERKFTKQKPSIKVSNNKYG